MNDLMVDAIGVVIELDGSRSKRRSELRSCLREHGMLAERPRSSGAPSRAEIRSSVVEVGPSADELLAWVKGD